MTPAAPTNHFERRYALLYSDGFIGVAPADADLEIVRKYALEADRGETDIASFTRVAIVNVEFVEHVPMRRLPENEPCPTCGWQRGGGVA